LAQKSLGASVKHTSRSKLVVNNLQDAWTCEVDHFIQNHEHWNFINSSAWKYLGVCKKMQGHAANQQIAHMLHGSTGSNELIKNFAGIGNSANTN
jgi:hypothetical protein